MSDFHKEISKLILLKHMNELLTICATQKSVSTRKLNILLDGMADETKKICGRLIDIDTEKSLRLIE